jgi:hypothetical protein
VKVDLFAYIGGSLGLCCGMSILTFGELVDMAIQVFFILINKKSANKFVNFNNS